MEFIFLVALIALNAFFAASEIALISLNDNKIRLMAEEGDKKAKRLTALLGEPSRFLATIQIGITLAGFLASAFAADSFADPLVQALKAAGVSAPASLLKGVTVVLITLTLSYFTLVLGELVPKRVAMKKSEAIAFAVSGPLTVLSVVAGPFVRFLTLSTNLLIRLFGIDPNSLEDDVTEEEIRMMVDVGEEKGAIQERERIMINNIFEFNNKTAEDIMTHRMEMVAIPSTAGLEEIIPLIREEGYSRIPVYEENMDDIIGILHIKDLLPLLAREHQDFRLGDYLRKPFFIPERKNIDQVFMELQTAKTNMGIVLDEYGGTAGIITVEDLVEEIVGNIFDEYDKEEDREIKVLEEDLYEISGMATLKELEEPLKADLPTEEFETLSGFLISLLGRIPETGEEASIRFKELEFTVKEATQKRIEKVLVRILPVEEEGAEEEEEEGR